MLLHLFTHHRLVLVCARAAASMFQQEAMI